MSEEIKECPFHIDDRLEVVNFIKPTPAHEKKYNVGDIFEVMFFPTQKVLILE